MALICIDIAIAKGATSSKNYSFRSASLRKLGRLLEAKHSAIIALELDTASIDAMYNLSKIYHVSGDRQLSKKYEKMVVESGASDYIDKLKKFYRDSQRIA